MLKQKQVSVNTDLLFCFCAYVKLTKNCRYAGILVYVAIYKPVVCIQQLLSCSGKTYAEGSSILLLHREPGDEASSYIGNSAYIQIVFHRNCSNAVVVAFEAQRSISIQPELYIG